MFTIELEKTGEDLLGGMAKDPQIQNPGVRILLNDSQVLHDTPMFQHHLEFVF